MNYIDILLLLIISLSIYNGWRKGFFISIIEMLSWMGSFFLSLYFFNDTARIIQYSTKLSGVWLYPLAFVLTLIISTWIINLLLNYILQRVPAQVHLNNVNKLMGTFPGFITGLIYATLLTLVLFTFPAFQEYSNDCKAGAISNPLKENAVWIENRFSKVFKPLGDKLRSNLTIFPKHKELVSLPFKVKDPKARPDLEFQMLEMVNAERKSVGLGRLEADPEFAIVARKHSVDMFTRGYFSHYTPERKDPFYRMRREGFSFLTAGENLALAANLTEAHRGLMNSPDHKANILHKSFGRVGIGIVDGGIYGIMITQNFRN